MDLFFRYGDCPVTCHACAYRLAYEHPPVQDAPWPEPPALVDGVCPVCGGGEAGEVED